METKSNQEPLGSKSTSYSEKQNKHSIRTDLKIMLAQKFADCCNLIADKNATPQNGYGRDIRKIGYDYNASTQTNLDTKPKMQRLKKLGLLQTEDFENLSQLETEFNRLKIITDIFGASLKVDGIHNEYVLNHLRDLTLLSENLLKKLVQKGMRVRISPNDMLSMSDNIVFRTNAPRGWNQDNWKGIPGTWDRNEKTAFAGVGGGHGCASLILHEVGHGIGDLYRFDYSSKLIEAHMRLFPKLIDYERQEGPRGLTGRQEFLAESFGKIHKLSKNLFVNTYDERWYNTLIEMIANIQSAKHR